MYHRRNSISTPPTTQPPTSLTLLSSLIPTFEVSVSVRSSLLLPRLTRYLELRGTVILLHQRRPRTTTDLQTVLRAIPLTQSTLITPTRNSYTARIGSTRLTFPSTEFRDGFITATTAAVKTPRDTYSPVRRIGRGASGTVYVAIRARDGKKLALKAIPRHDAFHSDSAAAHLAMERLTLGASSRSPGLVRLVDAFTTEKALCLVTELAEYGDLHHIMRKLPHKRFPEAATKALFVDILTGLMDLHRLGFLYRDMKLANVVVTAGGHAKLVDFGLAKRVPIEVVTSSSEEEDNNRDPEFDDDIDQSTVRILTRLQSFVGTRHYMSPEHHTASKQRAYGAPADVWALGVSLYLMVTGKYPFGMDVNDNDHTGLALSIKHDDLVIPGGISEELQDLLKEMLNREALERIDLEGVKAHPWLQGVNWTDARHRSRVDAMQVDVLKVFQQHNIPSVFDAELTDSDDDEIAQEVLSTVSDISADGTLGGAVKDEKKDDSKMNSLKKWTKKFSTLGTDDQVWSTKQILNRQEILGFDFLDSDFEKSRRQVVGSQ